MRYLFKHKRGLLILAAMILMTLFLGLSSVLIKITASTQKTSVGVIQHLNLNDETFNAAKLVANILENDATTNDTNKTGFNWVNYSTPSSSVGQSAPTYTSTNGQVYILNPLPPSGSPPIYKNSYITDTFLDMQKVAIAVNSSSVVPSFYTDSTTTKVNIFPSVAGWSTNNGGGYLVEFLGSSLYTSDTSNKTASYTFQIRPYACDKVGSAATMCLQGSNIATASLVAQVTRSCPKTLNADGTYTQLIVPGSPSAAVPGTDFYHLNCACPQQSGINGVIDSYGNCSYCPTGCSSCLSATDCTSCNSGYYLSGGTCNVCPSNATCSGGTATFSCQNGFSASGSTCSCSSGYTTSSGGVTTCNSCPTYANCNGGTSFTCPTGFTKGTNSCTCNSSNYISGSGTTASCNSCPTYASCNGGTSFTCPTGFTKGTSSCTCSSSNYISGSGTTTSCNACPTYATCNGGSSFTCPTGFTKGTSSCTCSGSNYISGSGTTASCNSCPTYATCNGGTSFTCPTNFTKGTSSCTCSGAISGSGTSATCSGCPTYASCSGGTFTCQTGFTTGTNSCTCSISNYISGSGTSATCNSCPTYATCNGGTSFTCQTGFTTGTSSCTCSSSNYISGSGTSASCNACPIYASCSGGTSFTCPTGFTTGTSSCTCGSSNYISGSGTSASCNACPTYASCSGGTSFTCPTGFTTGTSSCTCSGTISGSGAGATCTAVCNGYVSNGVCHACSPGCLTCTGPGLAMPNDVNGLTVGCTSCDPNSSTPLTLFVSYTIPGATGPGSVLDEGSLCVSSCPANTYEFNGWCMP